MPIDMAEESLCKGCGKMGEIHQNSIADNIEKTELQIQIKNKDKVI